MELKSLHCTRSNPTKLGKKTQENPISAARLETWWTRWCFFFNEGAIFERGTDEMQAAFRYAVVQFNRINETGRKFELQAFVDVINTADTYKLSRLSECRYWPHPAKSSADGTGFSFSMSSFFSGNVATSRGLLARRKLHPIANQWFFYEKKTKFYIFNSPTDLQASTLERSESYGTRYPIRSDRGMLGYTHKHKDGWKRIGSNSAGRQFHMRRHGPEGWISRTATRNKGKTEKSSQTQYNPVKSIKTQYNLV